MKKTYFILLIFLSIKTASAQVLLEDRDGEKIVNNNAVLTPDIARLALIKLNTGDQSLGFSYFISTALHNPARYRIHEFGLKAAPTEGYAAVFRNGQFSPGIKANYAFTIVNPFNRSILSKNIDWFSIDFGYNYNKYLLYQVTAPLANQLYNSVSHTYQALLSYNLLLKSKIIINIKTGYSRKNNYADLGSVEINDITTVSSTPTLQRQEVSSATAAAGNLIEYNAFPQVISLTRATKTDAEGSEDAAKMRIGYSLFVKNQFSSYLDKTDAGAIIFLTRQAKSGVRNPVLGMIFQAVNVFDTQKLGNSLQKRIRIGFTTNFSL